MKRFILATVLAILSCSLCPARKAEVKVMSFNIRHTGEKKDTGVKNWKARREAVVNMIRTEQPDVIGMQEVRADQKDYLILGLPEYQPVMHSPSNTKFIMFRRDRFQLLDQGNFWLSETPDKPSKGWRSSSERATLWAKLKDKRTGKVFWFFDTHLDVSSYEARIKGAEMCNDRMKEICGKKGVQFLVGDMNSLEPDCLLVLRDYLRDARLESPETDNRPTFSGFGFCPPHVTYAHDHIFYLNAQPLRFRLLDGKDYGVEYISDHYPIMFTAKF